MVHPLFFIRFPRSFFWFDGQGRIKWRTVFMVKVFFKRAAHLLTAFFAGGVCVLQATETSGFGIDLGNGSGTAQEGWTNVTMPATASGGANTFVAVPLIRNGTASSSSSVAVGSLFGRLVSLTVSARCSSGGSYTLAEPIPGIPGMKGGSTGTTVRTLTRLLLLNSPMAAKLSIPACV